ncbi:MAG: transglycosylase domain-containing protein [Clostridia bacterium]|nr:transglycosylase domain-containing protein [Clostridia bacterium]
MRENDGARVNWGAEVLRVLGIIGAVLLRILSYFFNILLTVLLIGLITGIIVATVFAIYINTYLDLEIDPNLISTVNRDSTTRIYYEEYEDAEARQNREGTLVEQEDQRLIGGEDSVAVSIADMPEDLINAFIAIEDRRFMEHNGVDWWTTAQSVFKFVFGGAGGGSTITQQLIKNVTGEDDVTIQRKVQEIFRALNLEKVKSKEEIIESYLNIVFFGNRCYGVQAAAQYYFGKDVSELTLVECASFAAIVKNPSQFNPKSHEEDYTVTLSDGTVIERQGNETRREIVLTQMWKEGYITETEMYNAFDEELVLATNDSDEIETLDEGMVLFSYYTEAVITDVQKDLMAKYNISSTAASRMLYNGLQIITPMEPYVQDTLEEVYENSSQYFPSTGVGLQPQSAMVVCDPYTNDVLGVVGGRDQKTLNRGLDRATKSVRPPGSSIKPLSVYAPALDAGLITYGSVVDDTPVYFNTYEAVPASEWTEAVYSYDPYPSNYPNVYMGLTTIQDAIERSVNTIAMKVLQKLSIDKSFDFMKNELGFDSLIESATLSNGQVITDKGLAALSLGQPNYGVTLLEMTSAYTIFPNSGIYNEPNLYLRVTDSAGNVILENEEEANLVISEETASIMNIMLEKVMTQGTGTGCTLRHTVDVAGKTGTTSADFDRYFVGYTPYYVGGVWTGYDIPQSLSAFGENPSLIVWDKVMTMLHQPIIDAAANGGEPIRSFETAPGVIEVVYCRDSGLLPSDACALDARGWRTEVGYFTRESAPTTTCDVHVVVNVDATTNRVASPNCNPNNFKQVALIRVEDRSFPIEVGVVDAQYVYRELPSYIKPGGWWGVPFFTNMLYGSYCGSSYVTYPQNAWCYDHCDFRPWGGNPPAVDSGYNPDTGATYDPDNTPEESSPETEAPPDTGQDEDDRSGNLFTEEDMTDEGFNWDEFFE